MNKKKLLVLVMTFAMVAAIAIGTTLAYFIDTDSVTNTFTAGKVGIVLDEAVVKELEADEEGVGKKNDLVADGDNRLVGSETATQPYDLHPAQTICKDPTITVDGDSLNAYVGAIITVTGDVYDLMTKEGMGDNIDIHTLASGGLLADEATMKQDWNGLSFVYETAKAAVYQEADKANNTWKFYVFVTAEQAANAKTVLFTTLKIPAEYENEEMAKLDGMQIVVDAYAAQVDGFNSCFDALTTAFPNEFPFGNQQ